MSKLITPIQPMILSIAGQKPAIPAPDTLTPLDPRFDVNIHVVIGQFAYNVLDDICY